VARSAPIRRDAVDKMHHQLFTGESFANGLVARISSGPVLIVSDTKNKFFDWLLMEYFSIA
jgi:hypothetical protein